MLKNLTASAATGFLLLGAPGVAMAQEAPTFPPLVVFSVQTTQDVVVEIVEGDPCADAIQALRDAGLRLQQINVIQESFLVYQLSQPGGGAILVCAPEGTEPPPPTDGGDDGGDDGTP
jgi:hypothetical protein